MDTHEPIEMVRYQDGRERTRDRTIRRHYRLSLALVTVLFAATLCTVISSFSETARASVSQSQPR